MFSVFLDAAQTCRRNTGSECNKNHCASSTTLDDSPGKYHHFRHFLLRSTFCGHVIELLGTVGVCDALLEDTNNVQICAIALNLGLWCFCTLCRGACDLMGFEMYLIDFMHSDTFQTSKPACSF